MFEKPCACKKSKANFKFDIGPFFVGECCTEAGFDEFGNSPEMSNMIKEVVSENINLKVEDDKSLDQIEPEVKKTKSKKQK